MSETMPSWAAWRASSSLDQWVMCRPLATGSKQARATIWARCRGGNPLGASRTARGSQQAGQAMLLVAAAGSPDGGLVALDLEGNRTVPHTSGIGQHDASPTDLGPG